jgi:hypothetical protein
LLVLINRSKTSETVNSLHTTVSEVRICITHRSANIRKEPIKLTA